MEEEGAAEAEEEEEGGGIASGLNNVTIETAGTEEEAVEELVEVLGIEVVEDRGKKGRGWGWRDSKDSGGP